LSQRIELPFPELPVFLNPLRCVFHRLGDQPAAVHASVFPPLDQPGTLKDSQVFRHGRERHFVRRGKIADGCFALREPSQDVAAGGIGKRGKRAIERLRLIVNHMVKY
jgi:hypothetical protein